MKNILNTALYNFFEQITHLGGLIFYIVILGLCLFLNLIQLFINLLISLFMIMLIASFIKFLYFKERPKKLQKDNFLQRLNASSFPSIHTMRMISLVFWFSEFFKNVYITIYFSIIALFVIYSRLYLKKHYFIDIIGGFIIATVANMLIWWLL
jgi:membrane-associated phospholipid phosphatase|tara:strand:+ start:1046 stop:1504 length:459 start_codon:yes stop_codon:yes gene_type:complete